MQNIWTSKIWGLCKSQTYIVVAKLSTNIEHFKIHLGAVRGSAAVQYVGYFNFH